MTPKTSIKVVLLKTAMMFITAALFMFLALATTSSSRAVADVAGPEDSNRVGTTNYLAANPQNCPKYLAHFVASSDGIKKKAFDEAATTRNSDTNSSPKETTDGSSRAE